MSGDEQSIYMVYYKIMIIFLLLFIAHCLADYYLQRHSWIMDKVARHERSVGLLYHMLTHVLLTGATLFWLVGFNGSWFMLWIWILIIGTHYLIDIWKTYQTFTLPYYLADQIGHIVVLILATYLLINSHALPDSTYTFLLEHQAIIIWSAALVFLANPMAITIMVILMPLREKMHQKDTSIAVSPSNEGHYIGILERTIVLFSVGTGQYVIPVLLLIGKLFVRLREEKVIAKPLHRQYVIFGTSLSMISALLVAMLVFTST